MSDTKKKAPAKKKAPEAPVEEILSPAVTDSPVLEAEDTATATTPDAVSADTPVDDTVGDSAPVPTADNDNVQSDDVKNAVPLESGKKKRPFNAEREDRIRFDYETGYVLMRASASTDSARLGGAIMKFFRDGARALILSFIGPQSMAAAVRAVCYAQEYLAKETGPRLAGKAFAIVPNFHEFTNENGQVSTQKFTLYLVDELKPV